MAYELRGLVLVSFQSFYPFPPVRCEEVLGSAQLDPGTVPGRKNQARIKDYYGELPFSPFGA